MNFCHLEDAARTVVAALGHGHQRAVYHASDSEPTPQREVVRWIAERLGIPAPMSVGTASKHRRSDRRVLAESTRNELGLELAYPSFREGLSWLNPRES